MSVWTVHAVRELQGGKLTHSRCARNKQKHFIMIMIMKLKARECKLFVRPLIISSSGLTVRACHRLFSCGEFWGKNVNSMLLCLTVPKLHVSTWKSVSLKTSRRCSWSIFSQSTWDLHIVACLGVVHASQVWGGRSKCVSVPHRMGLSISCSQACCRVGISSWSQG